MMQAQKNYHTLAGMLSVVEEKKDQLENEMLGSKIQQHEVSTWYTRECVS